MSLQTSLDNAIKAASNRAAEGQKLFSPIATLLDKHLRISTDLAPHLLGPLTALSFEITAVAQRHFDAFISGSTVAAPASLQPTRLPTPPNTRPPSGLAQSSYATVAGSTRARPTPSTKAPTARAPKKTPPQEPSPDNRLFVRLPNSHAARDMQGYAVLTSLRANLGTDGPLLKDVQTTKTGFALCPATPDALVSLEARKDIITGFFGQCLVERSPHWVSYRVTNVPRRVGQITDDCKQTLVPVDAQAIAQAVLEATKLAPTSVTETTYSVSNPTLPYSCWFVNFPEGTPPTISRQLRLFGTVATATFLPKRTAIVQCNRCWMWHNARSCARPPRCRLCGSTQHLEDKHSNRCNAPPPHTCPPRCMHCRGPHAVDSTDCPLRPKQARNTLTKLQKAEIRSSYAARQAQAKETAGCNHDTSDDQMAIDTTAVQTSSQPTSQPTSPQIPSVRPATPPPKSPPHQPPSTSRAIRFEDRPAMPGNRYDPLSNSTKL